MATLNAKRIKEALNKAKKVGRVEEAVAIMGCELMLQVLGPDEYDAIVEETSDLDGNEFLHAYQLGHLCRAIVEIDGVDLRGVDYVEDEVPSNAYLVSVIAGSEAAAKQIVQALKEKGLQASMAPPSDSEDDVRTIKVERHEWLRDTILREWGREALSVAWRKFTELLISADRKAKEGVTFLLPDESAEEKFRRHVSEMKELEDELPPELVTKLLEEYGYMPRSTPEELAEVARRMQEFQREQEQLVSEEASEEPTEEEVRAQELMRRRTPVHQQAVAQPTPAPSKVESPQEGPSDENARSRSDQIAALEMDPALEAALSEAPPKPRSREVPVLSSNLEPVDPKRAQSIIDTPPVVGINPRFHRPLK